MPEKSLIIIPTYNELDNVKKLIPDLNKRYSDVDILIVDDNSPDGTGNFVEEESKQNPKLHLIRRERKTRVLEQHILKDLNTH